MNAIDRLRARFQRPGGQPETEPETAPPAAPVDERVFSERFWCERGDCKCAKLYQVPSEYAKQHLKKHGEVWPYPAWKCPNCGEVKEQHCAEGLYHPHGFMSSCGALCDL